MRSCQAKPGFKTDGTVTAGIHPTNDAPRRHIASREEGDVGARALGAFWPRRLPLLRIHGLGRSRGRSSQRGRVSRRGCDAIELNEVRGAGNPMYPRAASPRDRTIERRRDRHRHRGDGPRSRDADARLGGAAPLASRRCASAWAGAVSFSTRAPSRSGPAGKRPAPGATAQRN